MTFYKFWPLYLRAHRLPGTRALHYFATIIGVAASIEAIATRQPLIFAIGVPLSYCIAIGSHRLIEGNQPLIRVNAAWGALADLRMCWLAIMGKLEAEFAKYGIAEPDQAALAATSLVRPWLGGKAWRHLLTMASAIGVTAALMDLDDLIEPAEVLHYPVIQLGVPIVAFAAALLVSCRTLFATRQMVTAPRGYATRLPSRSAVSLQRACLVLLVFGAAAFGLAELVEHGIPESPHALASLVAGGHLLG
ncbi:MAG TPA: DUF962 domain-containing protein [Dongiaceae bacterium]